MSQDAMLPCFKCGKTLRNAYADADNQPEEGTEFRTYGHYGSTFWDSFNGEQLVLNVCDDCLREHTLRLAQHKRYLPITSTYAGMVGKQWVERPMVPYCGNTDDTSVQIEPEEIGLIDLGSHVEWCDNAESIKKYALELEERND